MRFLITAGPTREPIDAVRYISNFSSGKMGYALATESLRRKHSVILVTGPTNSFFTTKTQRTQRKPLDFVIKQVETARQIRQAVLKYISKVDCLIMAAAVSDYRPAQVIKGKLKKDKKTLSLKLMRNPDILKEVGRKFRNKILVGFALESDNLINNALAKLREKRLDYIVANTPYAFGRDKTDVAILNSKGIIKKFREVSKHRVAGYLIKLLEKQWIGFPPSS